MLDLISAPNPSNNQFPDPINGVPVGGKLQRFNHIPGGINVLYLDGHVDFLHYREQFPASPGAAFFLGGATSWASAGDDLWDAYAVAPNGPF
jgi:prepilin-type processing-associated H-X9-DG protein